MLTLERLLQVQDTVEAAIKDVLATATGANVYSCRDASTKDATPWMELDFEPGQSTGHKYPYGGAYFDDVFKGKLAVRVVTNRQVAGETATHVALRGKIAAALTPGRGLFTTTNLQFHQLIDVRQSGFPFSVQDGQDIDVTELQFTTFCGIRPEAWALIGLPVYDYAGLESGDIESLESGAIAGLESFT